MPATSTHRRPTPPERDNGQLQAAADELRRHGWHAEVVRHTVVGDSDVRLEVSGAGPVTVELLDEWGDAPCADLWQAVHGTLEGRVVWCGPPRQCALNVLIVFVEDLLLRDPAELADRYTEVG